MTHQGMESRYLNRFSKIKQQTGDSIKNYDSAGNLAQHLVTAKASIKTQEENTHKLFMTAQEMVAGIDTTQQMFGHTFVRNMPQPSQAIKSSPSQQLGYVQLTMRFLQAGVLHFMEQMDEATNRIEHLEGLLSKLAVYDEDVNVLGEIQALDLDQLEKSSSVGHELDLDTVEVKDPTPPPSPPSIQSTSSKDQSVQRGKPTGSKSTRKN
jgi:hypothetical protein